MCLSKKILYQYCAVFCSDSDSCSSENILYVIKNMNYSRLFRLGKSNNRHAVYYFLKVMLGCRFSFEAYTKNKREKAIKCSLKPT